MANNHHPLVLLAKNTVEEFAKSGRTISPPAELAVNYSEIRAGAFVSIHQNGELRGCIGTYLPTKKNIIEEIIANAVSAANSDPRFEPVTENDLADLEYEVYILEKPEYVKSFTELNPKIFGVIVCGAQSKRSALLLPDLGGIDTVEQQLDCVCRKAGIDPDSENLIVQKFRAQKFG